MHLKDRGEGEKEKNKANRRENKRDVERDLPFTGSLHTDPQQPKLCLGLLHTWW